MSSAWEALLHVSSEDAFNQRYEKLLQDAERVWREFYGMKTDMIALLNDGTMNAQEALQCLEFNFEKVNRLVHQSLQFEGTGVDLTSFSLMMLGCASIYDSLVQRVVQNA